MVYPLASKLLSICRREFQSRLDIWAYVSGDRSGDRCAMIVVLNPQTMLCTQSQISLYARVHNHIYCRPAMKSTCTWCWLRTISPMISASQYSTTDVSLKARRGNGSTLSRSDFRRLQHNPLRVFTATDTLASGHSNLYYNATLARPCYIEVLISTSFPSPVTSDSLF